MRLLGPLLGPLLVAAGVTLRSKTLPSESYASSTLWKGQKKLLLGLLAIQQRPRVLLNRDHFGIGRRAFAGDQHGRLAVE